MNDRRPAAKCALAALPLILVFVSTLYSQSPAGAPPVERRVNAGRARQQDMSRREYQLRNFGKEPNAPKDRRQIEALMAQTEADFNRILTLHNEIARALASKDALNYRFVSDTTGEIKKTASRMQSSLALGLTAEETHELQKSDVPKDLEVKDALIKLCHQIRSFVTNPSIENPNTINPDEMSKAKRDLESVIQLSERIKKDADKLNHR
jgi:hypothetical protein